MKKIATFLLSLMLTLSLFTSAFAAESNSFNDVPADSWYATAVEYVNSQGIMAGISSSKFEPESTITRGMLAAVLYRVAGFPDADGIDGFSDTQNNTWYSKAVDWASDNKIISGYGNDIFGINDSVSREQIATILWRYDGSPENTNTNQEFVDGDKISEYTKSAVMWATSTGIMNGITNNRFEPQTPVTRAEFATILYHYLTLQNTPVVETPPVENKKVLVVYYSASGRTAAVAETITQTLSADTFEIVPVKPYTDADLTWTNDNSRVSIEHNDTSARNVELASTTVDHWEDYDTVFIGYPIWWGIAAWPVDNFVKNNDFTGKTVIPFCTSSSSGLGESGELLDEMAGTGDWLEGERFSSSTDEGDVKNWVEGFFMK